MSHHSHLLHKHLNKKKSLKTFDKFMLVIAFVYPITGIPQAIKVFQGEAEGVAVLSWLGFLLFVSIFLTYALAHRIKPMIITYSLWWTVDAAVVVGVLLN